MAHLHDVIDDDLHFKIDPETRRVYRTSENPIVLVQNDHNSERITFEVPKEIDGHDMTLCDKVEVHFLNFDATNTSNQNANMYQATDLDVLDGDENTLLFSWLVHQESTGYAGPLNFAISFKCTTEKTEEDGTITTIVEYSWNTLPNTEDIIVSAGMDNSDAITEDYYDVVDSWVATISAEGEVVKAAVTEHANQAKVSATQEVNSASATAKQSIAKYAEEVKNEIARTGLKESGVIVQGTGTATDKVMSQAATSGAINTVANFASSEAATVRSDLNERCADIEDDIENTYAEIASGIENLKVYKELSPSAYEPTYNFPFYKLEKNKLYYVKLPYVADRSEWDLNMGIYIKGVFSTISGGGSVSIDTAKRFTMPDYVNQYPDCYGFKVRVLDDGLVRTDDDNFQRARALVEIITGSEVYKTNITADLNDDETISYTSGLDLGSFAGDLHGVYVLPFDGEFNGYDTTGQRTHVYELNEVPSGVTDAVTFTVEANGISSIAKTNTSGLTDTYTIILDDGTTRTFTVTNGVGIANVNKTTVGKTDVIHLDFTDGTNFEFEVPNNNTVGIETPASGEVIHAEDVISLDHVVDVKVHSKNLIPYPYSYTTTTVNGITFTDNGDGSITANGTATANAAFYFANRSKNFYIEGPVHLSGCPEGGSYEGTGYSLRINQYVDGTEKSGVIDTGSGKTGTFDNVQAIIYFVVLAGGTVENLVVRPMLVSGTTAVDYTPYVDVSQVKLTRCGKNMFDPAKLLKANGWTVADGVYSGTPGALHAIYGPDTGTPICGRFEPNTQYTLSMEAMADITEAAPKSLHVRFVYSDGNYNTLNIDASDFTKYKLTSAAGKTVTGIYLSYTHNVTAYIRNIQLEKGATATDYEVYAGTDCSVFSNGIPVKTVTSAFPTMTLFADTPGTMIDAVYNVDQTAAYNKLAAENKMYCHKYTVTFPGYTNTHIRATVTFVLYSTSSESLLKSNAVIDINALTDKASYLPFFVIVDGEPPVYKMGYGFIWGGESVMVGYVDADGSLGYFEVYSPTVDKTFITEV